MIVPNDVIVLINVVDIIHALQPPTTIELNCDDCDDELSHVVKPLSFDFFMFSSLIVEVYKMMSTKDFIS